jgi:RHS repeat-associated protein
MNDDASALDYRLSPKAAWGTEASTSFDNLTVKNPLRYRGSQGYLHLYGPDACRGWSLYLAGARVYHTGVGRWLQEDPLLGNPGDPMSFNRYLYTNANPVDNSAPTGLVPFVRPYCPDTLRNAEYLLTTTTFLAKMTMGLAGGSFAWAKSRILLPWGTGAGLMANPEGLIHDFMAPYVRKACWAEYYQRLDGVWESGPDRYPFGWDKDWQYRVW